MINLDAHFQKAFETVRGKAGLGNREKQPKKCNCSEIQNELKAMEQRHEKEVKKLVRAYDDKISLLVKETSNKETSDCSKRSKTLKEALKSMEDELMVKDREVTELKRENSRLRRNSDKSSMLLKTKDSLVKELSEEIDEKAKQIFHLETINKAKDSEL